MAQPKLALLKGVTIKILRTIVELNISSYMAFIMTILIQTLQSQALNLLTNTSAKIADLYFFSINIIIPATYIKVRNAAV